MAFDKVVDSAKLDSALTATANAIRAKTGGTEPIIFDETQGFKADVEIIETGGGYEQGFEDGKNSVVQFERYTRALQLTSLNVLEKKDVVLNLDNIKALNNFCKVEQDSEKNITVEKITINCPNQITTMQNMFYCNLVTRYDHTLKHITLNVDTQKCLNYIYAFKGLYALEVIDGQPLDFSSVTNENYMSAFDNVPNLVECSFVANSIKLSVGFQNNKKLSVETAKSILLALVNFVGTDSEYANTVYFAPETLALLEAEGKTSPNGNTWLEYIQDIGWNA